MEPEFVSHLLKRELEGRRLRNPAYSLRAFARDLGVSVTALSDGVNAKRALSRKNRAKLAKAFLLSPEEEAQLFEKPVPAEKPADPHELLSEDIFRMIGEWHYFAILNLAKTKDSRADPAWIARRLGIEEKLAREALRRLEQLGFLRVKGKKLVRSARPFTTTRDIPSLAIRKHHLGNLRLAGDALENVPVDLRDFGSTIMPMNLEQVSRVKALLRKTREKAADIAETGEASEVYCLSLQLFPLTKVTRKRNPL